MADAYKGLTIRIGADATELVSRLKDVNNACRQTQSMLRLVESGLKFDPTSLTVLGNKATVLKERLASTNSAIKAMRDRLEEVGRMDGVREVAESTGNIAVKAKLAHEAYNNVNASLERMNSKTKSLVEGFNRLHNAEVIAFNKNDIVSTMEWLKKYGLVTEENIEAYKRLAAEHNRAFESKKVYDAALEFNKLKYSIDNSRESVKQYSKELASLLTSNRMESSLTKPFRQAGEQVEQLNSELRITDDLLNKVEKALRENPTSSIAQGDRQELLNDKIRITNELLRIEKARFAELNAEGLDMAVTDAARLSTKLEAAEGNLAKVSSRVQHFESELSTAKERAESLRIATNGTGDEYASAANNVSKLARKLDSAKIAEAALVEKAAELKKQLAAATSSSEVKRLTAELKALGTQLDTTNDKARISSSTWKNLGITLSMSVAPTFMMLGMYAVQAANDIDSAYRDMRKTVSGTEEEFQNLYDAAVKKSQTSAVSAEEILEIEAMGGQLGICVDELQTFADVIANLSIATDLDAETAAEELGQMKNVLGLSESELSKFGDALVRLGNNMPAQESAIMDVASRISSMASIVGMSTPDVLAWSAAIASTGQNSEAAGTAISRTMADIESAVGTGGEALEAFASVSGMTADDFREQWESGNVTGIMKSLIDGLNALEEDGGSATNTLDELGMSGVRQMQAIEGLMNTIGTLDSALTMSSDAWNGLGREIAGVGDAEREAQQKSEGFSGAFTKLTNSAEALGASLMSAITPYMNIFNNVLAGAYDVLGAMPDGLKAVTVGLGGLAVASGPAITLWSTLTEVFSKSGGQLKDFNGKVYETTAGLKTMEKVSITARGALVNMGKAAAVGLVIAGIAALVECVNEYNESAEKTRKVNNLMKDSMKDLVSGTSSFRDSLKTTTTASTLAEGELKSLYNTMGDLYDSVTENNKGYASSAALMEEYGDMITDNIGKTDEQGASYTELSAAVSAYNDATGDSLTVTKDADGAYQVMRDDVILAKDAIYELIDAYKAEAMASVAKKNYEAAYEAQRQAAEDAAAAQNDFNKALQDYNNELSNEGSTQESLAGYQAALQGAAAKLDGCNAALGSSTELTEYWASVMGLAAVATNENSTATDKWLAGNAYMQSALDYSGKDLEKFRESLNKTGVSTEFLGSLTQEELSKLAANYDGTTGSVISTLTTFGDKLSPLGAEAAMKFGSGFSSETQTVVSNVAEVTGMTEAQIYDLAQSMGIEGDEAMQNFATGILSGKDDVGTAVDLTEEEVNDLKDENFDSGSWGEHLVHNFADGMEQAQTFVSTAVGSIADFIREKLGHSIPKSGPLHNHGKGEAEWGKHLGQNFAKGIVSSYGDIESAALGAANLVDSTMRANYSQQAALYSKYAADAVRGYMSPNITSNVNVRNGITKADLFEAVAAISAQADSEVSIYVDGKKLASTIAKPLDSELGRVRTMGVR
jgi:TP901 family phage tail tape measure protein